MKSEKMQDRDFEKLAEQNEGLKPFDVIKPEKAQPETIYLSEDTKRVMVECEGVIAAQSNRRMEAVNNYLAGYVAAKGYDPAKTAARLNDDYTVTVEFLP